MQVRSRNDSCWTSIDWTLSNTVIARENKCNVKTVAIWRDKAGRPRQHRLTEQNKRVMAEGRKLALAQGKYDEEYTRKHADMAGHPHGNDDLISAGHLAHGEDHFLAGMHGIISPDGELFIVKNLEHFVRTNSELFDQEDVEVRRKPNGKRYCKAASRLQDVSAGRRRQWKGWTSQ